MRQLIEAVNCFSTNLIVILNNQIKKSHEKDSHITLDTLFYSFCGL